MYLYKLSQLKTVGLLIIKNRQIFEIRKQCIENDELRWQSLLSLRLLAETLPFLIPLGWTHLSSDLLNIWHNILVIVVCFHLSLQPYSVMQ
jgi:hypothetical protein